MPIFAIIDWSKVWNGYELWYAFFGVVLGSSVTLIIDHIVNKLRTKHERTAAKKALMERLEFNGARMTQMLGQFGSCVEVPNYPLDTTGIIIWLTLSYDVLDGELIKDINWHRYQLDHLNTKLHTYYLLIAASHPFAPDASVYIRTRELEARQSICAHLKKTSEAVCPLIRRLEKLWPKRLTHHWSQRRLALVVPLSRATLFSAVAQFLVVRRKRRDEPLHHHG